MNSLLSLLFLAYFFIVFPLPSSYITAPRADIPVPEAYMDAIDSSIPPQDLAQHWARIVKPPMKLKRHVKMDVCSPSGELETRVIPKSFSLGQGYKFSRLARWGDLWPYPVPPRKPRRVKTFDRKAFMKKQQRKKLEENVRGLPSDVEDDGEVESEAQKHMREQLDRIEEETQEQFKSMFPGLPELPRLLNPEPRKSNDTTSKRGKRDKKPRQREPEHDTDSE
jgi:Mitochondrial small ribosomal subunit Rsm22